MNALDSFDPNVANFIKHEINRQNSNLELIASENFVSRAILEAQGSILTNKYAEGYPGARYYNGCHNVDEVESIARERAKKLFDCEYVNVQPHSGSTANQAVFLTFLKPGDTILSMELTCGGHLTHGHSKNLSGMWFNPVFYNLDKNNYIDYNHLEEMAIKHKPKFIIAGFSSYSRIIDWKKFREVADKVGAILMADMAHVAGLVAAGVYPSPVPFADVVTTTTHKTLRGPRGGMILSRDKAIGKKIDSSVFPGIQGGPLMHVIAAKAVMLNEASTAEFKTYANEVVKNAKAMSSTFVSRNINVLTGGTDNHIVILDLRSLKISGKRLANVLDEINITVNKNTVPNDILSPMETSGIRIGTPACTTRGLKEEDFVEIANIISDVVNDLSDKDSISDNKDKYLGRVSALTKKFKSDCTSI